MNPVHSLPLANGTITHLLGLFAVRDPTCADYPGSEPLHLLEASPAIGFKTDFILPCHILN